MENQIDVIEGYCPNCWGYQEYQGKIFEATKKENVDLNNVGKIKGWIQAYAAKHFEAIKLVKRNGMETCPACSKA